MPGTSPRREPQPAAVPALGGRIGLGCLRLVAAAPAGPPGAPGLDPDAAAIAVVHAALDAGATLLDTADVYGREGSEPGAAERLVARALLIGTSRSDRDLARGVGVRFADREVLPRGAAG